MEFTGSRYNGETQNGKMHGTGEYTFLTGTKYVGEWRDGMFHSKGVMHFPNGTQYEAIWENGKVVEGTVTFADGLRYQDDDWRYCDGHDRRFYTERCSGLRPSGESQLTEPHPPHAIPEGCYDCGEGFYDPRTRAVTSYEGGFLRNAGQTENKEAWLHSKGISGLWAEPETHTHAHRHAHWEQGGSLFGLDTSDRNQHRQPLTTCRSSEKHPSAGPSRPL
ncbi:MORN repeat-containing protein 5 isoform X1 [Takifugu rubripes]|uniref:MORN repeat-containing protein 5 isoform X1 n=1 Tax=Takifugu rubripes TaxID=31033 RepID=UPI001145230C|nr:MORN repeat-containing protein 5 isoform X1 [Takifugu rubripes]